MPKKMTRAERRANVGLIILSVLVIGSLAIGAVASLVGPVRDVPTPTNAFVVTLLPVLSETPTPEGTPTSTPPAPAVPAGPAVAPTS